MSEKTVSNSINASTVFCDDIRREDSGKLIFVGVYGDVLSVTEVPAIMPTMCFWVSVDMPADYPSESVKVRIWLGDRVLHEEVVGLSSAEQLPQPPTSEWDIDKEAGGGPHLKLRFFAKAVPLVIEGACTIRVRVETDKEIIRAGALKLDVAKPVDASFKGEEGSA